jgi:hypothetical protein
MKENFRDVDQLQILERVVALPISEWNYRSQNASIRHIGPMSQDFFTAFGAGEDEFHISSVDADGVALVSIQGLYQLVQEKDEQIAALQAEKDSQQEQLTYLEKRIFKLEQRGSGSGLPINVVLLAGLCLSIGLYIGQRGTKRAAVI